MTAKQRHSKDHPFPLTLALSGLSPLNKVWVDYLCKPKSAFVIKVNDYDVYSLVKEEVDYDPSKTERLHVHLTINNKKAIFGSMPWILGDVEDKIQAALGVEPLTSLKIRYLNCNSWVANEFLDALCSYDMLDCGLDELILYGF